MASGLITLGQIEGGKVEAVTDFLFLGFKITVDGDCNNQSRIWLLLRRKGMIKLVRRNGLSSSHVWMWELGHKEGWTLKNWCFQVVVLEKILQSPLDSKGIKLVNPKGNQSWIFIGRTDAEAPIFWPLDVKSQLTGKDSNAGKDWRQKEKWVTGWDGWMASLTQRTWVWANSRR